MRKEQNTYSSLTTGHKEGKATYGHDHTKEQQLLFLPFKESRVSLEVLF